MVSCIEEITISRNVISLRNLIVIRLCMYIMVSCIEEITISRNVISLRNLIVIRLCAT